MAKPIRVGIVAGEPSGDLLGSALMRSLREQYEGDIIFEGIGGDTMIAEGFTTHYPLERLSVMGLVEVLGRLREILKIRAGIRQYFIENPPDIFIGIDAPDFNLTLERSLKLNGIRTMHYVSPSVWAWRQKRVFKVQAATYRVLTLLPFEASFYEKYQIPVTFVGHPLADQMPIEPDKARIRAELGIAEETPMLAVLPGSRAGEVGKLMEPFIETCRILSNRFPDMIFVIPAANKYRRRQIDEALETWGVGLKFKVLDGKSTQVMQASDAILIASGTATLEAMLCKRPMVVSYKVAPLTWFIGKLLVKIKFVSLPNLIANKGLVPELLQHDATPEKLSSALLDYLTDPDFYAETVQTFTDIHRDIQRDASSKAAAALLEVLEEPVQKL